jgi:K+-sensing histidine kinase KdpD
MRVAHDRNVGSIVVGHSHHGRLHQWMHGSVVHALWRPAADVGVHVVAARGPERH